MHEPSMLQEQQVATCRCTEDVSHLQSLVDYTPSNPKTRCIAADLHWQTSNLPCLCLSVRSMIRDNSLTLSDKSDDSVSAGVFQVSISNLQLPPLSLAEKLGGGNENMLLE